MNTYLKGACKILVDYLISLLLFGLFFLTLYKYLTVYSGIIFVIMFYLIYSEMRKLAIKEKRPQYDIPNYPFKGLVYGLVGFLPIVLMTLIVPVLPVEFTGFDMARLKHVTVNTILSPLFWFIKLFDEARHGYILSYLIVPIISMFGYMAGHYGFELKGFIMGGANKQGSIPKKQK